MAGVVIDATIQFIIQSLMSEAKLIIEVKADLEKLKKALEIISILSVAAERRKASNMAVKLWLKRLEDVAFDADNVLDEINYEVLRENMMPKPSIMTKMKSIFSSSRDKFAHKIREIKMRLDLISEEASKFGLQTRQYSPKVASEISETSPHIGMNSTFIGRENDMATILELLLNAPTEQVLSILPIVGMGGVGKTMLAANVFRDENIQSHFQTRIWIHVSKHFDSKSLLKRILSKIQGKIDPDMDKDALLEGLRQALDSKRFLLILDDVWIANHEKGRQWIDLMTRLRSICSTKGNAIITTMRSRSIPSVAGTLSTYELKGLSRDDCWSIIKAEALGEEDRRSSWFRTVGTKIAERCQGLPLAAKTVAELLHDKSKHDWLSVKEKWLSGIKGQQNYMLNQLKLSVDHLPDDLPLLSLEKCFAYCSVFPKGSRVEREQLIELWMAEGFLQNKNMERQTSDMESVGNRVVSLLVKHSLLEVGHIDESRVELYSMHDLMHDLAASLLDNSRYVSSSDSLSTQPENRAKVRSLFYQGQISGLIFSDFKSMHALTLSGNIKELPDSIWELLHLRLLDITKTKIEALPDSMGKLFQLQTFRTCQPLFGSAPLKKLPVTFKYLVSLRHIKVPGETELPPHVGLLTSLQTLPFFKVRSEEGYRIVELQNLKNLKGELKIENLEFVQGEEESSKAYLFEKSEIVGLTLMWNGVGEDEEDDHENVLKGLQPHTNLKILQISGFRGASFPSWTLKMAVYRRGTGWVGLDNLVEVKLISCHECEEIPVLGHLPCLQSLHLSDLKNVKIISSSFYGIEKCSIDDGAHKETITVFPALERLEMLDMPNLIAWADVDTPSAAAAEREVKVFPRLEYLEIKNCNQLRSAPRHFPCLKELKTGMMTAGLFNL